VGGNIVGSCLANLIGSMPVGLLGPRPLVLDRSARVYAVMMLLVTLLAAGERADVPVKQEAGGVLVAAFVVYVTSILLVINRGWLHPLEGEDNDDEEGARSVGWGRLIGVLLLSLAVIAGGAELIVQGAVTIASGFGLSDYAIGASLRRGGRHRPLPRRRGAVLPFPAPALPSAGGNRHDLCAPGRRWAEPEAAAQVARMGPTPLPGRSRWHRAFGPSRTAGPGALTARVARSAQAAPPRAQHPPFFNTLRRFGDGGNVPETAGPGARLVKPRVSRVAESVEIANEPAWEPAITMVAARAVRGAASLVGKRSRGLPGALARGVRRPCSPV
jgi:hypothetical protein